MLHQLNARDSEYIVKMLNDRFQAYAIILFGSAARGELRADSDIDLAFLAPQSPSPYELFMVSNLLADRLKREVDLIDFSAASTVFQAQIMRHYELLCDHKPIDRQYAFMRALKSYVYLNDERAEIIADKLNSYRPEGTNK
jgi:predicted nucleotidyltransferase